MEPIGTVGKIKITENGMIANVNLDNSSKSNFMIYLLKLEDRQFNLEFKYADIQKMRQDFNTMGYIEIDLALSRVQNKIQKEIKIIKRLIKILV